MTDTMIDSYGRQFHYLRLSITEKCNFKCIYCLPNGYSQCVKKNSELSIDEIRRLSKSFSGLGFWKIRLTGGEPTLRHDIVDIVDAVANTPGIKKVAMTTNGFRLKELARPLKRAGLSALNISIDSLEESNFSSITGHNYLDRISHGVDTALSEGYQKIKINAVFLKNINDHELPLFLNYIKDKPISFRFIELMRTSSNEEFFNNHHLSCKEVEKYLLNSGWRCNEKEFGEGPAEVYTHPLYKGSVGLISPYSQNFCQSCNRLRVSSLGQLRLCLFGDSSIDLRPYLQNDNDGEKLKDQLKSLLNLKPISHYLHEGRYGDTKHLASIGG